MSWLHVLAGVVGLGLGVYLVAALLFPERFSLTRTRGWCWPCSARCCLRPRRHWAAISRR